MKRNAIHIFVTKVVTLSQELNVYYFDHNPSLLLAEYLISVSSDFK